MTEGRAQTFQHLRRGGKVLYEVTQLGFLGTGKGKPTTPHLPELPILGVGSGQGSPRQEPTQPQKTWQRYQPLGYGDFSEVKLFIFSLANVGTL